MCWSYSLLKPGLSVLWGQTEIRGRDRATTVVVQGPVGISGAVVVS